MLRRGPSTHLGLLARSQSTPETFAEFYAEMSTSVLRFFVRETHDGHLALDLTAETFAKAFEKRQDFRGTNDRQGAAWLWAIARNELGRARRTRTVEMTALRRLGLERQVPTDDELLEIERMSFEQEMHNHLHDALGKLPSEQQGALRMRFIDELSYPEIAERLGVSYDVTRARVSRALRTLRSDRQLETSRVRET
ncbi:MAG: RNA polymerase sigma factor [Solirubrobacteraceae bacterium]